MVQKAITNCRQHSFSVFWPRFFEPAPVFFSDALIFEICSLHPTFFPSLLNGLRRYDDLFKKGGKTKWGDDLAQKDGNGDDLAQKDENGDDLPKRTEIWVYPPSRLLISAKSTFFCRFREKSPFFGFLAKTKFENQGSPLSSSAAAAKKKQKNKQKN